MLQQLFERHREVQARRNDEDFSEMGFTLIELLIVIVVLGILAAIVIFSLTSVTGTSAVSACNADAKTVETAVQAYIAQTGNLPAPVTSAAGAGDSDLVPTYLHTWPNPGSPATYGITYTNSTTAGPGGSASPSGEVQVATGNPLGTAQNYDGGNACAGA